MVKKTPGKSVSSSENLELTNTQGFSTTSCRNILKTSPLMKQYSSFLRYSMPGYRALTRSALLDKIIRVDHAGETGARKIYEGQLLVLGKSNVAPIIKEMCDQEEHHLRKFQELIPRYRVRPTALLPFWNLAGLLVGIGSAALGPRYAMACTVAVESVISEHYNNQIRSLVEQDPKGSEELLQILKQFRDEEIEHHDIGLQHDAEKAFGYNLFSNVIKAGCRASISLAELI